MAKRLHAPYWTAIAEFVATALARFRALLQQGERSETLPAYVAAAVQGDIRFLEEFQRGLAQL